MKHDQILLIIFLLIVLLDILKNWRILTSVKIIAAAIISYLSLFAFLWVFSLTPVKTGWLIAITILGLYPNIYYWKYRTSQEEKKVEWIILIFVLAFTAYLLLRKLM